MDFKSNEIKAGMVILAALLTLAVLLVAIFGIKFGKDTVDYDVYLQYVGGIKLGSLVKYRGLDVGQVSAITMPEGNESRMRLRLTVDAATPVRRNSRAFVTSIGLMSERHVEITAGSPTAELLSPGSVIESKEVLSFAQMAEIIGDLGGNMEELIGRLTDMFSDENRARVAAILGEMDEMVGKGRQPLLGAVDNLNEISRQLAAVAKDLSDFTGKAGGNVDTLLSNLQVTTQRANRLLKDMHGATANLKELTAVDPAGVEQILQNFQAASQNLEEFSRTIKERPWLLVRKAAPPQRKMP